MSFLEQLKKELSDYHLLKHPFYQQWTEGKLSMECLQNYASQYYHHVSAFPCYISAVHSLCDNQEDRKILLENLNEEEGFLQGDPHPELWLKFAQGLGLKKKHVKSAIKGKAIQKVINTFFSSCRSSYAEGLSSVYSYEYQVPEVAETKIKGLKEHYNITDKESLLFFIVHQSADVEHRAAIEKLLEKLPKQEQSSAIRSAVATARSLWNFLTSVQNSSPAAA